MAIDLAQELQIALGVALSSAMDDLKKEAVIQSSGGLSLTQLAMMNHPYAKKHGSPLLDPSVINTHSPTGFVSFWKLEPPLSPPDGPSQSLINNSPVADFLQYGTRFMFARPIKEELELQGEQLIESRVLSMLKAFEKRTFTL